MKLFRLIAVCCLAITSFIPTVWRDVKWFLPCFRKSPRNWVKFLSTTAKREVATAWRRSHRLIDGTLEEELHTAKCRVDELEDKLLVLRAKTSPVCRVVFLQEDKKVFLTAKHYGRNPRFYIVNPDGVKRLHQPMWSALVKAKATEAELEYADCWVRQHSGPRQHPIITES